MDITPINGFKNTRCTTLDHTVHCTTTCTALVCTRSSFHTLLFAHVTILSSFFFFTTLHSLLLRAPTHMTLSQVPRDLYEELYTFFILHTLVFFSGVLHNRRHSLLTASIYLAPIWDLWFSRTFGGNNLWNEYVAQRSQEETKQQNL